MLKCCSRYGNYGCSLQANLAVQEARYEAAMKDLNKAQDQLDEKEKELEAVQAQYDQAMSEKQVSACVSDFCFAIVSWK